MTLRVKMSEGTGRQASGKGLLLRCPNAEAEESILARILDKGKRQRADSRWRELEGEEELRAIC